MPTPALRILVTGSEGQLGRELRRQLAGDPAVATWFGDAADLDITDRARVRAVLREFRPDVVINAAAHTAVDACETDERTAFRVNALGPQNLAVESAALGAAIVHVSTDYVFSGDSETPYREYDPPAPRTAYGRSKLLGETLVAAANPRHAIARTAWLYGDGANFARTMLKLAESRDEVAVVDDQTGAPTCTEDLARALLLLARGDHRGIFHAACHGACTWHAFARRIFEKAGLPVRVRAITTEELARPARRPRYSKLENFMLGLHGIDPFRPWEVAFDAWIAGPGAPLAEAARKAREAR